MIVLFLIANFWFLVQRYTPTTQSFCVAEIKFKKVGFFCFLSTFTMFHLVANRFFSRSTSFSLNINSHQCPLIVPLTLFCYTRSRLSLGFPFEFRYISVLPPMILRSFFDQSSIPERRMNGEWTEDERRMNENRSRTDREPIENRSRIEREPNENRTENDTEEIPLFVCYFNRQSLVTRIISCSDESINGIINGIINGN